jgi:hypothetical protein
MSLKGNKGYSDKKRGLSKLISVNKSAIKDKIISNSESFTDIISY